MDDVIENCQTTFEEDGVNQQTLDDLRKVGLLRSLQSTLLPKTMILALGSSSYTVCGLSVIRFKSYRFSNGYFTFKTD